MFDWPLIFWREKRLVSVIQVELAFVLGNRVSRPGSQWFFTRSGLRPQERLCKCQPREHYMSVLKLEKSGRTLPTFWKWNKHDGVISGLSQISKRIDAQIGTIWYRQTTTSHFFLRETTCRGFDFPIRQPSAHMIQLQYTNLCSETGSSNLLTFATSSTALCNRVTQHIITLHSISSPFPDSFEVVPTFGPSNQIYVLETFWNPVRVWRGWRWTQRFHICSDIMVSS